MDKHTLGPWLAGEDNAGGGFNIFALRQDAKGEIKKVRIGHTSAVRSPLHLCGTAAIEAGEARANAVLMASSGELLASVRELLFIVEDYAEDPAHGDFKEEIARAKQVLARVQGGASDE